MESEPEAVYRSFNATRERLEIIQRLALEFAGVEIQELPSQNQGDFMKHIGLKFESAEQEEAFIKKMLDEQHQKLRKPVRRHNS